MGLFGSMTSGVSALLSQSEAISIISDNLSNVNTIGYKNSRTMFKQLVTSSGVSGTIVNAGGVGTDFERFQSTQGALLSTQSSTDLALSGSGFFTLIDETTIDNDTQVFYSRAGAFAEDNRGFLTNPDGLNLVGWQTDSNGVIMDIQNPRAIELQSVGSSARATSELSLGLNLDATQDMNDISLTAANGYAQSSIDVMLTPTTSDFVSDVRFFDSQGAPRDVTFSFVKRAPNVWDWMAYVDESDISSDNIFGIGPTNGSVALGAGTLIFNSNGQLKNATGGTLTAQWTGGVETATIDVNFGDFTGGMMFDYMKDNHLDLVSPPAAPPAGLDFSDGVLAITYDASSPTPPGVVIGAYGFEILNYNAVLGTADVRVTDPSAVQSTVTVSASGIDPVTAEFANGISISLTRDFDFSGLSGTGIFGTESISGAVLPYDVGEGADGVIQFASSFNTLFANQDGFGSGTLAQVSVDEEGFVVGSFTNGETKKLWKLVVTVFQDVSGLEPVSNNLLRETDKSGRPLRKEAGVGGTATVVSGALEQSTVDIANEFSNMIVSQRAFQAASTIISTVDQMLNELMQIR